ncbi:MAG: penicillin-binding transpeptidase domain-containing protein, partial [Anaerovorax sp.]
MVKKRMGFVTGAIVFIMGLLITRLAFVQLIDGEKYKNISNAQHTIALEGANQRGEIYDTNRVPFTGTVKEYVYIIEKEKLDKRVQQIFQLLEGRKVAAKNSRYAVFSTSIFSEEASFVLKRDYDAFALESRRRYNPDQAAVHLIGYINEVDGRGAAGIERDFNEALSKMTQKLYGKVDATGKIIQGEGVFKEENNAKSGVITTLDMDIQKKAAEVLKNSGHNGALMVTDVSNGHILASASYPVYNPYHIEKYLESPNMEFINKVTQGQYPPGSIFKIVVAAAAMEENIVNLDTKFVCKGYETIHGIRINCSKEEGHGELDFRHAFAKSCNSAFIQLGKQIGGEKIIRMAEKFGYGKKVLTGISDEKTGILSKFSDVQGAGIGNLSIGQGTLTVTPLQVGRATMIIANGGVDKGLRLV